MRVIDGPEVEAVDLLQTAGTGIILKIAIPVVVVLTLIVAVVIWIALLTLAARGRSAFVGHRPHQPRRSGPPA